MLHRLQLSLQLSGPLLRRLARRPRLLSRSKLRLEVCGPLLRRRLELGPLRGSLLLRRLQLGPLRGSLPLRRLQLQTRGSGTGAHVQARAAGEHILL